MKWVWSLVLLVVGVGIAAALWHGLGPVGGPVAAGTGVLGWIAATVFGRRRAARNDASARADALAEVDAVATRAATNVAAAQRKADQEVENAGDDLGSFLHDRDPGPGHDNR